jgi:protoporphyrinogen IX oxidase
VRSRETAVVASFYLWFKALHIVSVIAWMAGMLYLPRLFVYHATATPGSELSETLKVMERRLLRAIINPAMVATWVFGLAAATAGDLWLAHWLHVKLLLVLLLSGMHGLLARWRRDFERDANQRSARFYRFMNEVPTLLMIGIVILAVLKPF